MLLMSGSMDVGGSERQTCLLLKHLDRTQFEPNLYLTYRRGELLDRIPSDVNVVAFDDSESVTRVNWPGRWHWRMVRHLRRVIEANGIDVVYDRTFHMTLVAADACRGRLGRVSTIVCPPSDDLPSSESRFLAIKRWKLANAYRRSRQVIAVSDAVAKSASRYYGLDQSKIVTMRSPVDAKGLRAEAEDLPALQIPLDCMNIACIGRMTQEKGHAVLLAAIRLLGRQLLEQRLFEQHGSKRINGGEVSSSNRWVFWLIGDGPLRSELEEESRAVVQAGEESGVPIEIRFTGKLAAVAPVLSRCDLFVCPSLYEGLPNVVLEAMALGVPVIGSRIDGISEIVEHDRTGRLFQANDPSALASELMFVLQNRDRMRAMANQAAIMMGQSFGIEDYVRRISGFLQSAAAPQS